MWMAPSRISIAGRCGRKSLPTKKHMKTKSSMTFSRSYPPGTRLQSALTNSLCRYSRSTQILHRQKGVGPCSG